MRIVILILCAALISLANCRPMHNEVMNHILSKPMKEQFKLWHYVFSKPYNINSEEALSRYRNYKSNFNYIQKINSKNLGYTLGVGFFNDMTLEEMISKYASYKKAEAIDEEYEDINQLKKLDVNAIEDDDTLLAESSNHMRYLENKDWRYLWNNVRNQAGCGSCWAFATVAVLEGFYMLKYNQQIDLSEQQLIDCNTTNFGCQGGNFNKSFKYAKKNAVVDENSYPYQEIQKRCKLYDERCHQLIKPIVLLKDFTFCDSSLPYPDLKCTDEIHENMIKRGPYASSVASQGLDLFFYIDGIFTPTADVCKEVNHAVVTVGLTKEYIMIRNTWDNWGDNQYGKVARAVTGKLNSCGLLDEAYQPTEVQQVDK